MAKYEAKRDFNYFGSDAALHGVNAGDVIELSEVEAITPLFRGDVSRYETKVMNDEPAAPRRGRKPKESNDDHA